MSLTLLLLQARVADDPMREHECECFVRATGLARENVVSFDLCDRVPTLAEIRRFDALTIGGSGDFYVTQRNLPGFESLLERLREVVQIGHPTFASCFGYQLVVRALGGEIIHDPSRTEVGSYEMALTADGRTDELFACLPDRFWAQLGHKERATCHPDGIPNLVSSELSPLQALRVPGQPIWASQFHPELDRETNLNRFRYYESGYASYMSVDERATAAARFRESPEVSTLLPRFLELVST